MLLFDDSNTIGQPTFIPSADIVSTIIDLTLKAWSHVCQRADIHVGCDEPTIAGALYQELWIEKERRNIHGPPLILDEAAARSSRRVLLPEGWIDFKLQYDWGEESYFGMECKRISSTDKNLAREYVAEGVMRFVSGKYSPGHAIAAMIGFIIDGNMVGCIRLIREKILQTHTKIRMDGDWSAETNYTSYQHIYRTRHRQHGHSSLITILHLFLNISDAEQQLLDL